VKGKASYDSGRKMYRVCVIDNMRQLGLRRDRRGTKQVDIVTWCRRILEEACNPCQHGTHRRSTIMMMLMKIMMTMTIRQNVYNIHSCKIFAKEKITAERGQCLLQ
jgi:hypothetical protein